MKSGKEQQAFYEVRKEDGGLCLVLSGEWTMRAERPSPVELKGALEASSETVRFDAEAVTRWDSMLLVFVRRCERIAAESGLTCDFGGLPEGARRLLDLSHRPAEATDEEAAPGGWFAGVGRHALDLSRAVGDYFAFLGELAFDLLSFARGRSSARLKDFLFILQQTGPRAVPIVCLLSFLTGLIIAFIGVIQLQKFAADIYVADLVGLATTRELGAVMAGVIMAGRTGAAFAAQIGSMQVNEEIDALTTFGISPMRFLVVPRVVALVLMMPLLCACADFVAIAGGMVVAMTISDVSALQYFLQVEEAVALNDLFVGIFKSGVFGAIIAFSGCYRGLNCGRDATAVGLAATSAVVTAITWIVVADAVFAVMFHILGI